MAGIERCDVGTRESMEDRLKRRIEENNAENARMHKLLDFMAAHPEFAEFERLKQEVGY